jgi:nucleotide-binding universal stress UspA family protein
MKGRIILVVDETECGKIATERLEFLGRAGLNADVYIVFGSETELSPIVSQEKEMKMFTKLRLRASKITDEYKRRLEEAGFDVKQVKIFFGSVCEEVIKLEKLVKPDFIVFGMKKRGFLERFLHGDPYREIIFKTVSPVIVCKPGYERGSCDYDEMRCAKCHMRSALVSE